MNVRSPVLTPHRVRLLAARGFAGEMAVRVRAMVVRVTLTVHEFAHVTPPHTPDTHGLWSVECVIGNFHVLYFLQT